MKKGFLLLCMVSLLLACKKEQVQPVAYEKIEDHEGNEYVIKKYGNQTWMVDNMKARTTKDGQNILKFPANGQFSYEEPMAYFIKDKEEYTTNGRGYLYNFAAAQQICPDGWHLPSVDEWNTLLDYIFQEYTEVYNDDIITVAKAMASKNYWHTSDTVGSPGYHPATNNTSEFEIIPVGGYYSTQGIGENPNFYHYHTSAYLWTSDPTSTFGHEYAYCLYFDYDTIMPFFKHPTQHQAFSVRCVKDN